MSMCSLRSWMSRVPSTSSRVWTMTRVVTLSKVASTLQTNVQPSASSSIRPLSTQTNQMQPKNVFLSSSPASSQPTAVGVSNVSPTIASKVGMNLHLQPNHPLNIIKKQIESYFHQNFKNEAGQPLFKVFDNIPPHVTVKENFDELLFKADHPGRSRTDTFYFDNNNLLRTHTSAHQNKFLRDGNRAFLVIGDCYRRDEIDASHYPVFHQMEGVRIFPCQPENREQVEAIVADLKKTLEGLVRHLFGNVECRWIDAYFPFTNPSIELEIFFNGQWLEVLGSGMIELKILDNCGLKDWHGWAFGLGIERLAMILFDIPDIRLFWSTDARFLSQFESGKVVKFQPFSKFPPCFKDVSFWLPDQTNAATPFHANDLCDIVRDTAGDLVENVTLIDSFTHPKTKKSSCCFRILYRSHSRNLTNEEIDVIQEQVKQNLVKQLQVTLR